MTASTLQSFFPRACLEGERRVEKDRVKLAKNKLILGTLLWSHRSLLIQTDHLSCVRK